MKQSHAILLALDSNYRSVYWGGGDRLFPQSLSVIAAAGAGRNDGWRDHDFVFWICLVAVSPQ